MTGHRNEAGETSYGGIGFSGALTLLFIGLKLGHVVAWSWLWVLAPLWIPFLLTLAVIGAVLLWDAVD